MDHKSLLFILIVCLSIAYCREREKYLNEFLPGKQPIELNYTQKQFWFDQVLDHYDYTSTTTWRQRYWVMDDFYDPNVGPVFLYICGEWTCAGIPSTRAWVAVLAQKTSGIVLVL